MVRLLLHISLLLLASVSSSQAKLDRQAIVAKFNPSRNGSSFTTPMQVGNGDLAFSVDVTGLQTIQPFNTLSSWGWHNSSLPTTPGQTSVDDFTGLQWWTHGRLVTYDQPNPAEKSISQWLIANPHRINLVRIGFQRKDNSSITLDQLGQVSQYTDLYSGTIYSSFIVDGSKVNVKTSVHPTQDTIAIQVDSALLSNGALNIFFDYPYASGANKFDAPYVGIWNATSNHTTKATTKGSSAIIQHDLDATTYFTSLKWTGSAKLSGPVQSTHRYILTPGGSKTLSLTATLSSTVKVSEASSNDVFKASKDWWKSYWDLGAFVSFGGNAKALELQRRVILSQYLQAVNSAGRDPPQESGLTNNGWYGKFHLEMVVWHSIHFGLWGKQDILNRHIPGVYTRFLPTSYQRASDMGYEGARWGKMSDPSGRSAPGEINSLLIWQQPHPFYFAEVEYQHYPTENTLAKWNEVLTASADFMASYAFYNSSTGIYDLGPPMYPSSENTNPNSTINPTFEVAYWKFALTIAQKWYHRQKKPVPSSWTTVANHLPSLAVENGTYVIYQGIQDMWTTSDYTSDHPSMAMIYGLISPPDDFNLTIFNATIQKIYATWNFTLSYGWDFPTMAMAAARLGDFDTAVDFLLHPSFQFDDVGMPGGGTKVPTPYFPGASGLLAAIAMMAAGWADDPGVKFPAAWDVKSEGFLPMFF